MSNEFARHKELDDWETGLESDKRYYQKVLHKKMTSSELTSALLMLSKMLHEYHGIAPIVIIDEYDTPIQQGYMRGFYDEVILFMRNLLSG